MKVVINVDKNFGALTVQALDDMGRQLVDGSETISFVWHTLLDGTKLWYSSMIQQSDQPDHLRELLDKSIEDIKNPIKVFGSAQELINNRFMEKPAEPVTEPKSEPLQ